MTRGDAAKSQVRPALVTAGGLLLAVTVLQIAQEVIGVFSPRTSIQVALIVAVGLAAFTAERLRGAGPAGRDLVTVASGVGCVAAFGVAGAVWLGWGFSTPAKASVGEQIDDVRAGLRRDGFVVTYRRLRLHQGAASHLFVLKRGAASDELRLYDAAGGELRLALSFRPELTVPPDQPVPASFRLVTVADADGDGQKEILASYDTNRAGAEFQRVPVLISRKDAAGQYAVNGLLAVRSLGAAAVAGLPTYGFGQAPHVWVRDLVLDRGRFFLPSHATLATSVVLSDGDPHDLALTVEPGAPNGGRAVGIPRHVRFWELYTGGARPRILPWCVLTPGAVVRVPARELESEAFLGRPLADAMRAARVGLGQWLSGRCVDPAS